MVFNKKDLARYDSSRSAWILDAGKYVISSASSSRDRRAHTTIVVQEELLLEKTTNTVQPEDPLHVIKPCIDQSEKTIECT